MYKLIKIAVCFVLISLLAVPAFSAGKTVDRTRPNIISNVAETVYDTSAGVVEKTEGLFSGCLKTTFSFFNPCLDLVKGCTTVVLAPIQKPIDYTEGFFVRRTAAKQPVMAPVQRPGLPKK